MNNLIQINFKGEIVITTKMLAEVYECEVANISNNFKRNEDKFIEGKHYYKLEGEELKEFKTNHLNSDPSMLRINCLYLWTKRGASRHCKILGTDKSWDMFDVLEENYFNPKTPQLTRKEELQLKLFSKDSLEVVNAHKELIQIEVKEATKPLIDKIEEDEPLVNFANEISASADSIEVGQLAKLLKSENIKMGRNKLFEYLRENKYLRANNEPYQQYLDAGYFETIEQVYHTPYGDNINIKTLVTGKGQIKIIEKLRKLYN